MNANVTNENGTYNRREWNSTTNQDIKGRFVGREINENLNLIMQHLCQSEDKGDYYDEIINVSSQPDYESAAENDGWEYHEDQNLWMKEGEDEFYETAQDVCENENLDYDYHEAYEFWSVSSWLGEKLKAQGEMVEDIFGLTVWGRCTTGQAILLDSVISRVCEDLEILDGQKSSWAK